MTTNHQNCKHDVNFIPVKSLLEWDEYFMLQAMMASFKSKDPSTKVGAVFVDENNHQVITEPGVITQVLQEAVKEKGLFYPPDPASKGSCFIGGNVSENSGGPKAVKYGVTNEYVLNLEVVLPTGEIIWTGANVLKKRHRSSLYIGARLVLSSTSSASGLGILFNR